MLHAAPSTERTHRQPLLLAGGLVLLAACGGGGGGGGGGVAGGGQAPAQHPGIDTVLSSGPILPKAGGLVVAESGNEEIDGAAISIPAGAVAQQVTLSIGTIDELPDASPFGEQAVGVMWGLEPSGTQFAEPVTLTLPVPPGVDGEDLHVGRWNPAKKAWEDLGGTLDGDFISTEIDHLSLYALLYSGKSRVAIRNMADAALANLGVELTYISGPAVDPENDGTEPHPAYRPLPAGGVDLGPGKSATMMLLPGRYHFAVSFAHPQPGVATSLLFTVPHLKEGADDDVVDQTITVTLDEATSDDPFTDASIAYFVSNLRPEVSNTAWAPFGVPVTDAVTGGATTSDTRVVNVGPIKVEELSPLGNLTLVGRPEDPEGSTLKCFWTMSFGTLPSNVTVFSGSTVTRAFRPNPTRAGTYTVYLTVYDEFELFDECRWNIVVEANTKPTIDLVVDDFIIDFGRLDEKRRPLGALPLTPLAAPAAYIDSDGDGVTDLPAFKALPDVPGDHIDPVEFPSGMTAVYAIVFDADGDPLSGGFKLPTPIFGRGTVYAAVPVGATPDVPDGLAVGQMIDEYDEMEAYNATLFAMAALGALPVTPPLPPSPVGAQALPILWEAPDDPPPPGGPGAPTHDCVGHNFGCSIAKGGTVNLLATVTDGYSKESTDYGTVGFPDADVIYPGECTILSFHPSPPDPAPYQGVTVTASILPATDGIQVDFSIVGTDGYSNSSSPYTDSAGKATFYIPGGAPGVVDVVTVECDGVKAEVTYAF